MRRGPAEHTPTTAVRPAELVRRTLRRALGSRIVADREGATAVEFGILALPFLALVGAIFESALCFLAPSCRPRC